MPGIRTRNANPRNTNGALRRMSQGAAVAETWAADTMETRLVIRVRRETRFEGDGRRSRCICESPRQESHTFGAPVSAVLLARRRRRIWTTTRRRKREVLVGHTADDHQVYRWTTHCKPVVIVLCGSIETMTGSSISKTSSQGKRSRGMPSRPTRSLGKLRGRSKSTASSRPLPHGR